MCQRILGSDVVVGCIGTFVVRTATVQLYWSQVCNNLLGTVIKSETRSPDDVGSSRGSGIDRLWFVDNQLPLNPGWKILVETQEKLSTWPMKTLINALNSTRIPGVGVGIGR